MTDPRQRTRPASPSSGPALGGERERVLARRRLALIVLVVAVPASLVAAILTGSTLFLVVNLVFDVFIAGYVALLLQIKQGQDGRGPAAPRGAGRDVRARR